MGNFVGALGGVIFSGGLLGGLTAAAYYIFCLWRNLQPQPSTLAALIAVVLLVSWLIGWAIAEDPRVGQVSHEAYDASDEYALYDHEERDALLAVSFALPLLQFFCGSLYQSTRQLFGAKEP